MKKVKYSVGDQVIVSINKRKEIAIITQILPRKMILFNIMTEKGSYLTKVPISSHNDKYLIFIDETATDKLSGRIKSTLSIEKVTEKIISYEELGTDVSDTAGKIISIDPTDN